MPESRIKSISIRWLYQLNEYTLTELDFSFSALWDVPDPDVPENKIWFFRWNMHLFTKWSPPLEPAGFSPSKWIPLFLCRKNAIVILQMPFSPQICIYSPKLGIHFDGKSTLISMVVPVWWLNAYLGLKSSVKIHLCNMTPRAVKFYLLKKILVSNYIYPQNIRINGDALDAHFHVWKSSVLSISYPKLIIHVCVQVKLFCP